MARDLNILCHDAVFKLTQMVPLDMFPQTAHVESVAELRRTQTGLANASPIDSTLPAR
jgi:23S rRNA (uracil1939-C5)-methyltransferase